MASPCTADTTILFSIAYSPFFEKRKMKKTGQNFRTFISGRSLPVFRRQCDSSRSRLRPRNLRCSSCSYLRLQSSRRCSYNCFHSQSSRRSPRNSHHNSYNCFHSWNTRRCSRIHLLLQSFRRSPCSRLLSGVCEVLSAQSKTLPPRFPPL